MWYVRQLTDCIVLHMSIEHCRALNDEFSNLINDIRRLWNGFEIPTLLSVCKSILQFNGKLFSDFIQSVFLSECLSFFRQHDMRGCESRRGDLYLVNGRKDRPCYLA